MAPSEKIKKYGANQRLERNKQHSIFRTWIKKVIEENIRHARAENEESSP